jgi:uncharacterized protein YcbX
VARVAKLAIAPVKGLALVHPPTIDLDATGVPINRRFCFVAADGRHRSGLAFGPLATIVPDYDPVREWLVMTLPDGRIAQGDACDLGKAVELPWGHRSLRGRLVRGPWSEAVSDFAGVALRLVRADPGQNLQSRPVSIISQATLDELERSADLPGPMDDRRFRMLLTLDGAAAWAEEGWIGRDVAIGEAVVNVELRTARCATTTRDPATGLRDWDALRAVKQLRGLSAERTIDLGVYANVVRPGRVTVGDEAMPLG